MKLLPLWRVGIHRMLSRAGLLYVISLSSVSLFMFRESIFYESSYGLWFSVVRPGFQIAETKPGWGHPLLQIDSRKRWFLDGKQLSRQELPNALWNELKSHADRRVFLEAARDLDVKDAVSAMDIIHRAQGDVVLVTPEARTKTQCCSAQVDETRVPAQ